MGLRVRSQTPGLQDFELYVRADVTLSLYWFGSVLVMAAAAAAGVIGLPEIGFLF